MKTKILILTISSLFALTACKTPHPAPGNELAELIMHKDFILVARDHPEFASYCVKKVSQLEIEQCWANYQKMEAIKRGYKKIKVPAPVNVQLKPIVVPPPLPPNP